MRPVHQSHQRALEKKFSRMQAPSSKFSRVKVRAPSPTRHSGTGRKIRARFPIIIARPPRISIFILLTASIIGVEKSSRERINGCLRRGCHHFRLSHAGGEIPGKPFRSERHATGRDRGARGGEARRSRSQTVDECIMGNVVSAGLGQNPARQAAIFGGLPPAVGAMTINKVCGSGLKAVALAAQAIQTENIPSLSPAAWNR